MAQAADKKIVILELWMDDMVLLSAGSKQNLL